MDSKEFIKTKQETIKQQLKTISSPESTPQQRGEAIQTIRKTMIASPTKPSSTTPSQPSSTTSSTTTSKPTTTSSTTSSSKPATTTTTTPSATTTTYQPSTTTPSQPTSINKEAIEQQLQVIFSPMASPQVKTEALQNLREMTSSTTTVKPKDEETAKVLSTLKEKEGEYKSQQLDLLRSFASVNKNYVKSIETINSYISTVQQSPPGTVFQYGDKEYTREELLPILQKEKTNISIETTKARSNIIKNLVEVGKARKQTEEAKKQAENLVSQGYRAKMESKGDEVVIQFYKTQKDIEEEHYKYIKREYENLPQPLSAMTATSAAIIFGFANPKFWSKLVTEGPEGARKAIAEEEWQYKEKYGEILEKGDTSQKLSLLGRTLVTSYPMVNIVYPMAMGMGTGYVLGATAAIAPKAAAIAGKGLTAVGYAALTYAGVDVAKSLWEKKTEDALTKVFGYGMQFGSAYAGYKMPVGKFEGKPITSFEKGYIAGREYWTTKYPSFTVTEIKKITPLKEGDEIIGHKVEGEYVSSQRTTKGTLTTASGEFEGVVTKEGKFQLQSFRGTAEEYALKRGSISGQPKEYRQTGISMSKLDDAVKLNIKNDIIKSVSAELKENQLFARTYGLSISQKGVVSSRSITFGKNIPERGMMLSRTFGIAEKTGSGFVDFINDYGISLNRVVEDVSSSPYRVEPSAKGGGAVVSGEDLVSLQNTISKSIVSTVSATKSGFSSVAKPSTITSGAGMAVAGVKELKTLTSKTETVNINIPSAGYSPQKPSFAPLSSLTRNIEQGMQSLSSNVSSTLSRGGSRTITPPQPPSPIVIPQPIIPQPVEEERRIVPQPPIPAIGFITESRQRTGLIQRFREENKQDRFVRSVQMSARELASKQSLALAQLQLQLQEQKTVTRQTTGTKGYVMPMFAPIIFPFTPYPASPSPPGLGMGRRGDRFLSGYLLYRNELKKALQAMFGRGGEKVGRQIRKK